MSVPEKGLKPVPNGHVNSPVAPAVTGLTLPKKRGRPPRNSYDSVREESSQPPKKRGRPTSAQDNENSTEHHPSKNRGRLPRISFSGKDGAHAKHVQLPAEVDEAHSMKAVRSSGRIQSRNRTLKEEVMEFSSGEQETNGAVSYMEHGESGGSSHIT
jgi:hypothetical protein